MDSFFNSLARAGSNDVFNPWFDHDIENDINRQAPETRRGNLKKYLDERRNAKYLLLAEALGYQGGHFTGIPMTSERIVLGNKAKLGIFPSHVCSQKIDRTSNQNIHENGFNEPTATIVWEKLISENLDTRDFVFWNAFPWHPYKSKIGILTNRTPTNSEMKEGESVLGHLLKAMSFKTIVALGNKSHVTLEKLDIESIKVRHPAMGGASMFRKQFMQIFDL